MCKPTRCKSEVIRRTRWHSVALGNTRRHSAALSGTRAHQVKTPPSAIEGPKFTGNGGRVNGPADTSTYTEREMHGDRLAELN